MLGEPLRTSRCAKSRARLGVQVHTVAFHLEPHGLREAQERVVPDRRGHAGRQSPGRPTGVPRQRLSQGEGLVLALVFQLFVAGQRIHLDQALAGRSIPVWREREQHQALAIRVGQPTLRRISEKLPARVRLELVVPEPGHLTRGTEHLVLGGLLGDRLELSVFQGLLASPVECQAMGPDAHDDPGRDVLRLLTALVAECDLRTDHRIPELHVEALDEPEARLVVDRTGQGY
mmetsp:Transcript_62451/g.122892  ORF Transcript_62451/g.122892 Transcript_62451/m.122892 type:complete len:232 (-) Transcript_62451:306-1001(-)